LGEAVRRRHATYYLDMAQEAEPALHRYGVEQAAWMDRLERERDNLHAALDWSLASADVELGLRLCLALGRFWEVGLWHDQGRAWLARALDASAPASARAFAAGRDEWTPLRAGALNWAGTLAVYSDPGAALALQEESLALWRETGDERGIGYTLCELGIAEYMLGDLDRARPRMEAGIAMLRDAGDTLSLARALYWYTLIPLSEGDLESARTHTEESARLSRQIGALAHTATTIRVLGYIAQGQGDYAAARAAYAEDLRLARQARDRLCIEQCLDELGRVAYAQADIEGALGYWREALELYRSSGDRRATARTVLNLGGLAHYQGDDGQAEPLLDEGLALARELGDPPLLAWALHERGQLALDRGDRLVAVTLLSEGLDVSQEIEHPYLLPVCLAGLAAAQADPARVGPTRGGPTRAGTARMVRLFGAAQALLDVADIDLDRGDQATFDRYLATARAGLDEAAYTRAWTEGSEMAERGAEYVIAYVCGSAPGEA
jgi:tetratricopeptide (TPR) repeat protein